MGLTALDILVLTLVGGGTVLGFMRGFVQEVLTLAAWVAAIVAVRLLHAPAAAWLTEPVGTAAGASMLAYVLVFGVTFFLFRWLSRSIGAKSRKSLVGPFDRVLGGGFGMVKGMIIATALFMLATLVHDFIAGKDAERPQWMRDSRTFPALNATSAALSDLIETRRARPADADRP